MRLFHTIHSISTNPTIFVGYFIKFVIFWKFAILVYFLDLSPFRNSGMYSSKVTFMTLDSDLVPISDTHRPKGFCLLNYSLFLKSMKKTPKAQTL